MNSDNTFDNILKSMIWQETSTYNNEDNDNTPNDNGIGTIVPTPGRRRINPNCRLSEFCHRNRTVTQDCVRVQEVLEISRMDLSRHQKSSW